MRKNRKKTEKRKAELAAEGQVGYNGRQSAGGGTIRTDGPQKNRKVPVRHAQMGGDYEISHISGGAQSPGGSDQCR